MPGLWMSDVGHTDRASSWPFWGEVPCILLSWAYGWGETHSLLVLEVPEPEKSRNTALASLPGAQVWENDDGKVAW